MIDEITPDNAARSRLGTVRAILIVGADVEVEETVAVVIRRAHRHKIIGSGQQSLVFESAITLIGGQHNSAHHGHGKILVTIIV